MFYQVDEWVNIIDELDGEAILMRYVCKMKRVRHINTKLVITFFWIFIATIIIFQLLAANGYNFERAITYSVIITGTFAVYAHLVARRIVKEFILNKHIPMLIFWILVAGMVFAVALSFEDYTIDSFFDQNWSGHKETLLPQFFGMFMAIILITGIAYAYELTQHHIKTLKASQVLKDSLNDLEVKSIRQQLSPHFTFNILNNLQFLIQKDKDEALKLLSQYSKILRYYVYESQNKAILLNDEISFLKTFLELEKDSLKDEAKIEIDISIVSNDLKVAPFILSTFVENAFKHVSLSDKWISVVLHYKENELYLNVRNTYDLKSDNAPIQKGIGLEHAKKRLQLIYPDRHALAFDTNGNIYSVELKIKFG